MKKVLICMTSLATGNGIAKVMMNYYDDLIEQGYNIDFLIILNLKSKEEYLKKLNIQNSNIFIVPEGNKIKKCFYIIKMLPKLIKNNEYDIVHVNLVSLYAFCCIWISKLKKVKNIIYHIHNPIPKMKKIKYIITRLLNWLCIKGANKYLACSISAGKSVFKNRKFEIIRNLIDTEKYAFDKFSRHKYRKEFNIVKEEYLIGNIARFEEQKNPFFIIDVVNKLVKDEQKVKFLWIGEGSLKKQIIDYIDKLGIKDKCIILNNRSDVNKIYSAMDLFFLPSNFEGLGIVFIEAQCAGLPVLTSNEVPKDIQLTDLVHILNLNEPKQLWKEKIIKIKNEKSKKRDIYVEKIRNKGYDISDNTILSKFYDMCLNVKDTS